MKSRPKKTPHATPPTLPEAVEGGRRWIFRLLAFGLPLLLLVAVEGGLRLGGYGFSTRFFRNIQLNGQEFLVNSDSFTLRFLPPELARWPEPILIPAIKSPDTTRIFIFGESAAMGDPRPAYGASRFMEVLLRDRFPGRKFEVVNTGITAVNSHVILPVARECARQHGDIWIVYMGNNEMVGPFGAATIFGGRAPPVGLVRINLALQQLRLGQLASTALRRLGGASTNTNWEGLRMFLQNQISPDDPRRTSALRNFEVNLRDILRAGQNSGARVVLSTVSVNLGDCPPFASMSNSNLPAADEARFQNWFKEGVAQENAGNNSDAARSFAQAASLDPKYAEAQYRWAECLRHSQDAGGSASNSLLRLHYQLACDMDALPFRADSRVNGIIRRLGSECADRGVVLSDAESALANASPLGIAGEEMFYEHVHFSLRGNYLLGRQWADAVSRALPEALTVTNHTPWATQETCESALGLTPWERGFLLEMVIGRMQKPPLSSQFNNAARVAKLQAELNVLLAQRSSTNLVYQSGEMLMRAIQRAPQDHWLYENLAGLYESVGDLKRAAEAYRKVYELLPADYYSKLQLGRFLSKTGKAAEAEPLLRQAAQQRPRMPDAWVELGHAHLAQKQPELALAAYERAARLRPSEGTFAAFRGRSLAQLGRHREAVEAYRRYLQLQPTAWEPHFGLATELAAVNDLEEASREYGEAIRIHPGHIASRVNLGVVLFRQGRFEEAIHQFEAVLQVEPSNAAAAEYLRQARARPGSSRR